jgi:hypothetical protein
MVALLPGLTKPCDDELPGYSNQITDDISKDFAHAKPELQ